MSEAPQPRRPSRLRRFFLRHLPFTVAGTVVFLALAIVTLYFCASSARFENYVREQMIAKLETATGGRVEIASFHWNLLHLEAEANGLVIHGLEAPSEAPYLQVKQLRVQCSLLSLLSPRLLLRDVEIAQPQAHLIVYTDGSTNQPQPRKPTKSSKSALDWFFDLKVSRVSVDQGLLDSDNRAAAFDFQNRYLPLDFVAKDVSVRMAYVPAVGLLASSLGHKTGHPESYHIEVEARDLDLARGAPQSKIRAQSPPVEGLFQATIDLTRTNATLRSLRITAHSRKAKDRTLEISGTLDNFAHPRWKAKIAGDLDMSLLEPLTGYPFDPAGIARLDLAGSGEGGGFRLDGSVHVDNGSYIGTGVVATGVGLDARVHADPRQLTVSSIVARLRQGGQITGDLQLAPWLPPPSPKVNGRPILLPPDVIEIPVNGKVTAEFKDVALDTILEMVTDPPFQHLGLDTRVSGSTNAQWVKGDNRTLSVDALLNLVPPTRTAQGLVPTAGQIDATYTQRDGAVDLRKLELHLPSSEIAAHGHMGAYPLTSSSGLAVDFHTGNLSEFDTVLRDLGMTRNGKSGTAALPVALNGQADFHGNWTGSLVDPHLAGSARATQLAVEIPPGPKSSSPQFVHIDTAEATGSYSAARIDIAHAELHQGNAGITLDGNLTAAPVAHTRGSAPQPGFDSRATAHLRLHVGQANLDAVRPFLAKDLPATGTLDAQLQIDGPLRELNGAGWLELTKGSVFDEPIDRIRAQGNIVNENLKLTSVTISGNAGKIAAAGSYDLRSGRCDLNAKAAGLDVARLELLRRQGVAITGKLGFSVEGSCTPSDPRLTAHATLSGLTLSGEPLGRLEMTAHTANRAVTYDVTTQLDNAELAAHGETALSGDYNTHAKLDFSQFDIASLFKLAHVQHLSGQSSLAGTVTLEGPLAKPDELRGEARINELAVTVSGVHLKSEGGLHALLANAIIHLDPLHIIGELTDLHAQGSLSLKGKQMMDLTASGAINLKVAEILDPDLTASGSSTFQFAANGTMANPDLRGQVEFKDGAFSLEDLPNGLSQLNGRLEFNQNRLEVKSLTAVSGGGQLKVNGYFAYQHGLYADMTATGNGIRIRYPQGISSQANAQLHLQGQQNSLLLSGNVLITRFTVNPDLDIAALVAQTNTVESIPSPNAPSNHIRMDVHITSSPQLNFQNAYAKLAGNVDLRLRGTVASPSLLGSISITEGSTILAGTRYELQRGDILFNNPVRIQPTLDLNATARVEDYDITLSLHGTPDRPTISYRSDPPLPEADVVALLALGRTESQQRIYTQQQEQTISTPTTDALLGGALNAAVSSRVQRLFGAASVKVDPNYLGVLGNSTSRIIVEEQLGPNVTLTYATDVNTTAQQLIQGEVAINRHVSVVVARDESGVYSMVIKATRRYR